MSGRTGIKRLTAEMRRVPDLRGGLLDLPQNTHTSHLGIRWEQRDVSSG